MGLGDLEFERRSVILYVGVIFWHTSIPQGWQSPRASHIDTKRVKIGKLFDIIDYVYVGYRVGQPCIG
jgi:hypothetical protein